MFKNFHYKSIPLLKHAQVVAQGDVTVLQMGIDSGGSGALISDTLQASFFKSDGLTMRHVIGSDILNGPEISWDKG